MEAIVVREFVKVSHAPPSHRHYLLTRRSLTIPLRLSPGLFHNYLSNQTLPTS